MSGDSDIVPPVSGKRFNHSLTKADNTKGKKHSEGHQGNTYDGLRRPPKRNRTLAIRDSEPAAIPLCSDLGSPLGAGDTYCTESDNEQAYDEGPMMRHRSMTPKCDIRRQSNP